MYYEGSYFMGGMHWIWWIFWVALVGSIVFYGWGGGSSDRRRDHRESPLAVLKWRLANGDISVEEYEQRKLRLDGDASEKN